ncbi:Aldo/keto reductase [Stereum hirsutum FP-91666 SS1]|uniref:Aldo/keto reductase n=1 Tax=Stereum hirsutum (strain FP-91666) TaxID=721885 RepID=UPI0004449205|nr:Aldo/keto reductase [Stereum hirsutum FP-91666 SS1]EIM83985.1 Aldo/keto reductase [Stereum hirsutum FP-91666 SS1]
MPVIGLGCWMGEVGGGERVKEMVTKALDLGYRHFDTAAGYGNENMLGEAIKISGVPREQLYITTKLGNSSHHRVLEAFEESLAKLDCGYIDMYLMHWPQAVVDDSASAPSFNPSGRVLPPYSSPTIIDTWLSMQSLLLTHRSRIRSIGVSNFSIKTLNELLSDARVTVLPAVNQVECHPYLPNDELKKWCSEKGIAVTAYSPLGQPPSSSSVGAPPNLLTDSAVLSLAAQYHTTPAQILLGWGLQHGTAVIPKSENEGRLKANITIIYLSESDIAQLDVLHRQPGKHRSLLGYIHRTGEWGPGVFGWSYEMLGWEGMQEGGVIS